MSRSVPDKEVINRSSRTDLLWEYGPCPLCGCRGEYEPFYRFSPSGSSRGLHQSLPLPGTVQIVRCRACGLHYLFPRPREECVRRIYGAESYFSGDGGGGYEDYRSQASHLKETFRRFLRKLDAGGLTGGGVADIGCGLGYLLEEASPFFSVRMGTELCREAAEAVSEICDGVVCGGAAEMAATGNRFRLVVSVGVLEHVYEPVSFLKECGRLAVDDGAVVLVTPDMQGPWRRLLGKRWPSLKLPEHIAFYDRKTLADLGTRAGMVLEKVIPFHQVFPLGLVLKRLGIRGIPTVRWGKISMPLPNVMMAGVFKKTHSGSEKRTAQEGRDGRRRQSPPEQE